MNLSLLDNIDSKTTVLVPSRRLSTKVREQIQTTLSLSGKVWATPHIYALDDWLNALWDQFEIEGVVKHLLLNSMQVLLRFEQIVANSDAGKVLLRQHQAAKTALQAWHNLHHWLCEKTLYQCQENIDQASFTQWALTYQEWLNQNNFIDNTLLPSTLLPLFEGHDDIVSRVSPRKELILYGFEELSPLWTVFFESLQNSGWLISHEQAAQREPFSLKRLAFAQKEQEYVACAHWAKKLLDENKSSIAIVVPNLADEKVSLEKIFRDHFEEEYALNPVLEICPYFNISAATPLIQYPLIIEAISLIKLALTKVDSTLLSDNMKSVFVKGAISEQFARATFAGLLKQQCEGKISLKQLLMLLKQNTDNVPLLENILNALHHYAQQVPRTQSMGQWANTFKDILMIVGWPGERTLSSVEYQLVKRMDELFNESMLCDAVLEPQSAFEALSHLQKIAANIPFQAENKKAPIQILGLLEAVGQNFEHLWIMGMDAESWPPVANPNPFISIELQREHKMPHASAAREMAYAQKVTERFKASADQIIFSYALKDKEKLLSASELIDNIQLHESEYSTQIIRCESSFNEPINLESVVDETAPQLELNENFKGTTTTLRLQALCPFKAFAEQRLDLKQPQVKSIWLQSHQEGTILHDILEEFWACFKTQENLNTHSENDISKKVKELVEKHLKRNISSQAPITYYNAQSNRLYTLLLDYIQLEKQRAPFKVIIREEKFNLSLADIPFSLRVDRVDEVNDEHIIIDYKSGKFGFAGVFGERIESPQLPLYYCASSRFNTKAVMAIKLNTKACEFEGISESQMNIAGVYPLGEMKDPDKPEGWQGLYSYWHEKLTQLAIEFKSGHAQVSPHSHQECEYCHLKSVCRIHEVQSDA